MSELFPQPENGDILAGSWFRDKFMLSVGERVVAYGIGDTTGAAAPTWQTPQQNYSGDAAMARWLADPSGIGGKQKDEQPPWFSDEGGDADIFTSLAHFIDGYLNEDANGGLAPNVADSYYDQFRLYDTFWPAVDGDFTNYHNALLKARTSGASHGVLAAYYRDKPPSLGGTPEYEIDNIPGYIFGPWMFTDLMRMLSLAKHSVIYPTTMYSDTNLTFWFNPHVPHTATIWRRVMAESGDTSREWGPWSVFSEYDGERYDCPAPPPPSTPYVFGEHRQYCAVIRWHFTYEGVAA